MAKFEFCLDPATALPFMRALLRVEAELLVNEANELTVETATDIRSKDQRRADAFVELAQRFSDGDAHAVVA